MRFKYIKILTMLLIFSFFLTMLSPLALAVEPPGFELPIRVKLSGSPPAGGEDYRIVLKADNLDYPMPVGSEGGIYNLIIRGANTVKLPKISFPTRGIYEYTIYQLAGSNSLATYDDAEYKLRVYVTNASESSLETTVVLYLVGEEGKLGELEFENNYRTPLPPPTPDPDPDPDPDPTPTPTPTPTPDPVPEEPEPEVEVEEEIPEGIPEVEEEEEEVEIEEEIPEAAPIMPKTGDLSSSLYYGLGTILIGLGIGTGRKKKK